MGGGGGVNTDKESHNEPAHVDLHCLLTSLKFQYYIA